MTVLLPSYTVTPQRKDLAENVKAELISRLQNYTFALQMDQCTDMTELAVSLV